MSLRKPEIDLLLACGRAQPEVASWVGSGRPVDWQLLLGLADNHGMLPLLSRAVRQVAAESVPPAGLDDLRTRAAAKALRSLYMTGELARILRTLESAGLAPIAFKGPTLAWLAYGNFGLRDSADLDIFVPRSQVADAVEVLAREGYRRKSSGCFTWLRGECEMALDRSDPNCQIDLHWLFSPRYFLEFDPLVAGERSIVLRVPGLTARTLCPEDLLLYLAVHSGRECWALVRSVCDVAALIRNCPLDWDDVVRQADRSNCWRPLAVGLHLAAGLCDAPVPPEILAGVRNDRAVARIAACIESNLYAQRADVSSTPAGAKLQLDMLEGPLDKFRFLWRRAVHPNHFDADFVRLPERLAAGYYVIRPLRVASAVVSRAFSSS